MGTSGTVATVAGVIVAGLVAWYIIAARRRNVRRKLAEQAQLAQQQAAHDNKMAQLQALLNEVRGGDRNAIRRLTDNFSPSFWYSFSTKHAKDETAEALATGHIAADMASVRAAHMAWEAAEAVDDVLATLMELYRRVKDCYTDASKRSVCLALDITLEGIVAEINKALHRKREELVARATAGDQAAFVMANQLHNDTHQLGRRYPSEYPYYRMGVTPLLRPQGWNELVHRFLRDPSTHQIDLDAIMRQRNVPKLTPSAVAHMAADAERDNDPWLAKVVIALGVNDEQVQETVGEILWAEMLRLVAHDEKVREIASAAGDTPTA